MIILGIETSFDETAAAVVEITEKRVQILSNIISSSASLHEKFGGVVPEHASREQLKVIIPAIQEAFSKAHVKPKSPGQKPAIDEIAVTQGPGLIGSLLVGVETAKTLALTWDKPLIPVNHLIAHFYACWTSSPPKFPYLGLLASGGHTDLLLFQNHKSYKYLGGTRDDAAGECFDKCARILGLPYPGGPNLSKMAENGNPNSVKLPLSMTDDTLDLSYSGLKTAVADLVKKNSEKFGTPENQNFRSNDKTDKSGFLSSSESCRTDLAASIENAIVEQLVRKTLLAAQKTGAKTIVVAGGVAANSRLRQMLLQVTSYKLPVTRVIFPPENLCTDNAVTTAIRAFYDKPCNPMTLQANPNLYM